MTRWTVLKAFLLTGGLVATVLPIYRAAHQTTSRVSDALREQNDSKSEQRLLQKAECAVKAFRLFH